MVRCSLAAFADVDHNVDPKFGVRKECWCALQLPAVGGPRVATVTLTKDPPDIELWLQYHHFVGVAHSFFEAQDETTVKELRAMQSRWPDKVTVWEHTDPHPQNMYQSLMDRQLVAMAKAKDLARQMSIEWLVHMDDDELLYLPDDATLPAVFANVPASVDQVQIPNVEAVYKRRPLLMNDSRACFMKTDEALTNTRKYSSYTNGKPAVRTFAAIKPAGPHMWTNLDGAPLNFFALNGEQPFGAPVLLIHYESCPISRWVQKFQRLNINTSAKEEEKIPFPFYRDSMDILRRCRDSIGAPGCAGIAYWIQKKTDGIPAEDGMPIAIPWAKIM